MHRKTLIFAVALINSSPLLAGSAEQHTLDKYSRHMITIQNPIMSGDIIDVHYSCGPSIEDAEYPRIGDVSYSLTNHPKKGLYVRPITRWPLDGFQAQQLAGMPIEISAKTLTAMSCVINARQRDWPQDETHHQISGFKDSILLEASGIPVTTTALLLAADYECASLFEEFTTYPQHGTIPHINVSLPSNAHAGFEFDPPSLWPLEGFHGEQTISSNGQNRKITLYAKTIADTVCFVDVTIVSQSRPYEKRLPLP